MREIPAIFAFLAALCLASCIGTAENEPQRSPDAASPSDARDFDSTERPERDSISEAPDTSAPPDIKPAPDATSPDADVSEDGDAQAPAPDIIEDAAPSEPEPLEDPTHSSQVYMADPDTVIARDGKYITYGTTIGGGSGPRCGKEGLLFVPYLEHGGGNSVRMSDCAAGDAMPDGPGAWAEPNGHIWAPGVARHKDKYIMFYSATKRGTNQKCIGRAHSQSARGPFQSVSEWACPPEGRWAIDPNPFVADGKLYVAYRDDYITYYPETGLSVVQTDDQGGAIWDTRRDLLKSTDISWDTISMSGDTRVVENPSLFQHEGTWYLAYSGNNWDSPRYAIGIADCGPSPLPAQRCTPLQNGVARPYFGYTGSGGLNPFRALPGDHPGPGGMDVFHAADGTLRAIWHWWQPSNGSRHVAVGRLLKDADGFYVSE